MQPNGTPRAKAAQAIRRLKAARRGPLAAGAVSVPAIKKPQAQPATRFVVLCSLLLIAGCSEAPSSGRPWQGWATSIKTGKQEWFFSSYASYDDCKFRTEQIVAQQAQWYRTPIGCQYDGYQNAYVQWIVNKLYEPNGFKCIARLASPELQRAGKFYGPVLRDHPDSKSDNWYCYLNN